MHWLPSLSTGAGANRVCEIPSAVRMFCSNTKRHFLTPTNLSKVQRRSCRGRLNHIQAGRIILLRFDAQLVFRQRFALPTASRTQIPSYTSLILIRGAVRSVDRRGSSSLALRPGRVYPVSALLYQVYSRTRHLPIQLMNFKASLKYLYVF